MFQSCGQIFLYCLDFHNVFLSPSLHSQQWERQTQSRITSEVLTALEAKPPSELACAICSRLLTNASRTACCRTAFCDECIRKHLERNDFACYQCKRRIRPEDVRPDAALRRNVEEHKRTALAAHAREIEEREKAELFVLGPNP